MIHRYKYRLQRKEKYSMPCTIGNRSYPLPTYRWKDVAISDDNTNFLTIVALNPELYRIDELENEEKP